MTSENRSIYVDGQWCSNENGVMTFPLENQLEVQGQDMVATFDDFSLSGNISSVSPHCNRVYCLERSPKAPFNYIGQVLAREQMSDAPEVLTITITPPGRHETLLQFTHTCELPSTHRNKDGGNTMVFYVDVDGLTLVGHLFHETVDFMNPTTPLPIHDDVSGKMNYTTGFMDWTCRVPLRFWEFGWHSLTQLTNSGYVEKLRILELPTGDWSAASFRPLLERMLNEGAFTGTDEDGSGSLYVVEGTGDDVHIRLAQTSRFRTDQFRIVGDEYLRSNAALLKFPGQYDAFSLRSVNKLLGNAGKPGLFSSASIPLAGAWTAPTALLSRTHAAGTFSLQHAVTPATDITVRTDVASGGNPAYQAKVLGIPIRHFTVDSNNALVSTERMISNSHWTYLGNTLVITATRNMPETVALQGSWTRQDLQGNTVGAVSVTTTNGTVYDVTLPADIVGASGSWTQSGIGAQTWAPHTGQFEYVYDTDKIITFLEWGFGGNGPPVIRFRETHGVPVTSTLGV